MKMHRDEVRLTAQAVARLVAAQFPAWERSEVHPVASSGTVNGLFLIGDDVVARFPLVPHADLDARDALRREHENARRIASACASAEVPTPIGIGRRGAGYPGWWSVCRWIPGEAANASSIADTVRFARDLASFVRELQSIDTRGQRWNGRGRGGPLATKADDVGRALAQSSGLIDVAPLARVWERCLRADASRDPDVWLHADLMPGNLLVRDGRLAAVIDLGAACVGDPAVDLMPAWNFLAAPARHAYRQALDVCDATWERGRGWAIAQAIVALPYYIDTNPAMAETARHTLAAALEQ